jgi:hypothetical protein
VDRVTSSSGTEAAPVRAASIRARLRALVRPERRISPTVLIAVAVGIVLLGQIVEDLADGQTLQMLPPITSARRWTLVAVVLYELAIARLLDQTVQRSLPAIERVLRIDAATFRSYVHRLEPPDRMINAVLLAASALIVTVLFVVLGLDLPMTDNPVTGQKLFLPTDGIQAFAVLAGYTVAGWAGLSLIYLTVRVARALEALSREPLEVDVFDTSNLLPFGNIALANALAPVGIIVILLVGLGSPTAWFSWTVLLLAAVASILALLLPLRGIHRQMGEAKERVLASLNARIRQVFESVDAVAVDGDQLKGLNERTNTLIPLRKTVAEMTTWPFADTVAFGRAILIASAPLIYTVLSELIKVFWINPLSAP